MIGNQERAAQMIAGGAKMPKVSAETGISVRELWRLKKEPAFIDAIKRHGAELEAEVSREGIANKALRVRKRNMRAKMLERLILHRSQNERVRDYLGIGDPETYAPEAGLIVVRWKGKEADTPEYAIDTPLLAEIRNLERDQAIEVGDWKEKHILAGENGELAPHVVLMAEMFTPDQLREMKAKAAALANGQHTDDPGLPAAE